MDFNLGKTFRPKFFSLFRSGRYSSAAFASDLAAGVIVGIIALPLAIAFGIASGVTPQQGLITAIVAGFLVSVFGGSRYLIGGPTGAFIVIVSGIVAQYGIQGLVIATIMAGVILVIMGLCRMGAIFRFIPYPIVVGFTSGIALTIFSTQIKDFFGLDAEVPSGFIPEWICYIKNIGAADLAETSIAGDNILGEIQQENTGFPYRLDIRNAGLVPAEPVCGHGILYDRYQVPGTGFRPSHAEACSPAFRL